MARNVFFLTAFLFLFQACQTAPPGPMTEEEKAEVAEGVSAAVDGYVEAIKQLDFEAAGEFWANDEDFVIAGDGTLTVGYDAWMSQVKGSFDGTSEVNSIEVFNPHIYVLARDAAAYSMEFRWSMTLTEGALNNSHGSWTYVFKHLDGRWRVVHSAGTHVSE